MHKLKKVHSDLKPENILFKNSCFETISKFNELFFFFILLIFRVLIEQKDIGDGIIQTREHRCPEVL